MKNCITVLSITIALFFCVGCASQSQNQQLNNVNSINELGTELSALKSDDDSKAATNTPAANTPAASTSAKTPASTTFVKQNSEQDTNKDTKPLSGLTICIDAGHGKITKPINKKEPIAPGSNIMKAATASGTSGVYTKISEESLNLTVAKKLKKALSDKGAKIVMVRETSICNLTNVERTKLWNSSGAELTIRLHGNGINDSKVSGVLMMIPGNKYIKNEEMLKKSTQAGQYILDGVLKHTKAKSRGTIISTDMTGFNWSEIPVVLLEMGFMTNPQEDKLINTDAYQNKLVSGIVEGVEKYQDILIKNKTK